MNDTAYRLKISAGIIGALLVIWAIYSVVTYRKTENFTVAHIGWDTQIGVQQYQTVHEGGWRVPSGGRETDSYRKQRGTRSVPNGTERVCSGTGKDKKCSNRTKYRQEPVYDRWYEYDIDRWLSIEPLTAAGNQDTNKAANRDTHEWYWPDTSDGTYIDSPTIGNKRLGLRQTHFFIVFNNDNKDSKLQQIPVDMPEERWKTHHMGAKYSITFGWFNNILEINKVGAW